MEEKSCNNLNLSEVPEKGRRKDFGGKHRKSRYGDIILRRYGLNGVFEAEYGSIEEAVEGSIADGIQGVTYAGVYCCINGRGHKHAGKLWRCDKGRGVGKLAGTMDEARKEAWLTALKVFMSKLDSGYCVLKVEAVSPETGECVTVELGADGKEVMPV